MNISRTIFYIGPFACELYGMVGSLFGVTSIWTMVFIALDRYNVIVKVNKQKYIFYKIKQFIFDIFKKNIYIINKKIVFFLGIVRKTNDNKISAISNILYIHARTFLDLSPNARMESVNWKQIKTKNKIRTFN